MCPEGILYIHTLLTKLNDGIIKQYMSNILFFDMTYFLILKVSIRLLKVYVAIELYEMNFPNH